MGKNTGKVGEFCQLGKAGTIADHASEDVSTFSHREKNLIFLYVVLQQKLTLQCDLTSLLCIYMNKCLQFYINTNHS